MTLRSRSEPHGSGYRPQAAMTDGNRIAANRFGTDGNGWWSNFAEHCGTSSVPRKWRLCWANVDLCFERRSREESHGFEVSTKPNFASALLDWWTQS